MTTVTTGTNNYVSMTNSPASLTVGQSTGTNGNWFVTVTQYLTITNGLASEYVYGCIVSSTSFTIVDASDGGQGCVTSHTNTVTGMRPFGEQSASTLSQYGLTGVAIAHVTVPSNGTYTFDCKVAASTSSAVSTYGYCSAKAEQN